MPAPGSFATHTWTLTTAQQRRRKKHHKAFSGCLECKRRRLKCDEEKPCCARCLRGKLSCNYQPPKVWMFEPTTTSKSTSPRGNVLVQSPHLRPARPEGYQRALLFYQERACPVFAAYFGADFWNKTVLQISQGEDLVRRTVATASVLIESLQDPTQQLRCDFYHGYNRAIKEIADPTRSHSIESLMTACGLFASFELCLGSVNVALTHVRAGLQIARAHLQQLAQEGRSDAPEAVFLIDHILPILAAFALQGRVYGINILSIAEISELSDEKYGLPQVPSVFSSPQEAHHCLSGIIHHFALFESSIGCAWDWQLVRVLGNLLVTWTVALDSFERHLSSEQERTQRPSLCILRCNQHLALCIVKGLTSRSDQTNNPNRFQAGFGEILSEYKTHHVSEALQDGKVTSTELEILPLLFIIAIGSLEEEVRNEALRILADLKRKEANWSSQEATEVAVMILEQSQETEGLSDNQKSWYEPLTTCLHIASVQWPMSHVVKWLHPTRFVELALENCRCRSKLQSTSIRYGRNLFDTSC